MPLADTPQVTDPPQQPGTVKQNDTVQPTDAPQPSNTPQEADRPQKPSGRNADSQDSPRGEPWRRHTIDNSSRGADGARLADANGDGRLDLATGWEEGGLIRVYLHPGSDALRRPWPAVTVGRVDTPEDAVLVDLDHDGAVDVVSCCEGKQRAIFVHWAPRDPARYLDPSAWTTQRLPAAWDRAMWMFALPLDVDGRHGVDLVAGGKGPGAEIGYFEAPPDARRLDQWRWHPWSRAGWIMSIEPLDVDGDGHTDVLYSDRRGKTRGVHYFHNPGRDGSRAWNRFTLSDTEHEVMFLGHGDLNADSRGDLAVATIDAGVLLLLQQNPEVAHHQHDDRTPGSTPGWATARKPPTFMPRMFSLPEGCGRGKGIAIGDIDLDGQMDLVLSCEYARDKSGVVWFSAKGAPGSKSWTAHEISGTAGTKFDLIELTDLDADGDLDVITTEERQPLGVVWYENPARQNAATKRAERSDEAR
jgi:hypothetical protein